MAKTTTRWFLAGLLCMALWPAAAQAQSPELADAYNRYSELRAEGRYQDALPFAKEALRLGEPVFGSDHRNTATLLNNIAALYDDLGRYADAEPLYERSLAIFERALGPEHPDVATGLNNVARLYHAQGRYAEAVLLYQRSLAIMKKALGPEHPDVAVSLNNTAELYRTQGRYAEAEPLYQLALAIREKALGLEHPSVGESLNNLAALYQAQGRYAEAELLYQRTMAVLEKALGPGHPNVATSINNLASLYDDLGRYTEAEPLYQRALAIREKALGPDHPDVARSLNNLAELYRLQGRYAEAEPFNQRSLSIKEKVLGPGHPSVATSVNNLAELYRAQGRYAEAEPLYQRALAILEKALGPEHPDVATILNNLAGLNQAQGRYAEAELLYQRTMAILEKALGLGHPSVATSVDNLATLYDDLGRYAEAEPLHQRALGIREKALGPDHPDVARSLNNLAELYRLQGRYAEAEPFNQRSLSIKEKVLGPGHPSVATSVNNLAELYRAQGRYADAEPLHRRALAIREKVLGPGHPSVATSLNNLAELYSDQGRYAEAEPLNRRALAIREEAQGPEHPDVATILNNLAGLNQAQGRYAEAELLYQRTMAILEKALGPGHPSVATSVDNLATLYDDLGRYAEAEPLHQRALAIRDKALGPDHPDVARSLNNLASLYQAQGRYADSEPLHRQALAIQEKALGREHPDVAQSLNNLASLYYAQGRYAEAEPPYRLALAIREKALGPEHLEVAQSLNNLSVLYDDQDRHAEALEMVRRGSGILRVRATRLGIQPATEAIPERAAFTLHVRLASRLAEELDSRGTGERLTLVSEAFEVGQLAQTTAASHAIARMSARFARGDDTLAGIVRDRQDSVERWRLVDKKLIEAVGKPPDERKPDAELSFRAEIAALEGRLDHLDSQLADEFPDYAELATPQPLSLHEAQELLGPDEALIAYLVDHAATYVWVITSERAQMLSAKLGREALDEAVAELRRGLDLTGVMALEDIPSFDTNVAYDLYQQVFAPAEPLLNGVRHVMIVPDGALQSLPFGVLVSEPAITLTWGSLNGGDGFTGPSRGVTVVSGPSEKVGESEAYSDYRGVSWLAERYAITVLPSVSSLRALRQIVRESDASKPFAGFGDPVLAGDTGAEERGPALARLFRRGPVADVDEVRRLPSLPETASELREIAKSLGAETSSIYLQGEATEAHVKSIDLSDTRVIAFATHGLVAGELSGVAEPALVLTPPETGTENDDGLLTSSEIAQLKLNADWVILSACNTAAGDRPGAEGLSGLSKAFFYAGSRALLVSHWPVASEAAVQLTTRMFEELAAEPGVGRSEALRRSMLAMIANDNEPRHAHPMFWAPFVVVGEGWR